MKKILKNNSIIITALCIMIAIVWYLNYTDGDKAQLAGSENVVLEGVTDDTDDTTKTLTENGLKLSDLMEVENESSQTKETAASVEDGAELETAEGYESADLAEGDEMADISDEDLAALETATSGEKTEADSTVAAGDGVKVSDTGDIISDDETNTSTPGEAVLASTSINASYFASAKLTREQNRAREKASLMEMMDSDKLSDEVKQKAVDSYLALNEISEKENATELLLGAKGFEDAVVTIVDDSVEVVINAPTITEQQIAQIESIVKRKTDVAAENIVISPVVVEE